MAATKEQEQKALYLPPPEALQALEDAWRNGTGPGGNPRLVLVLGQDGVGKSALLEHFAAGLEAAGAPPAQVLSDKWSPEEFDPFAPFLNALGLTYVLGRLVPGVPRKAMHWAVKLTMSQMSAVPVIGLIPGVLSSILEDEVQGLLDRKPVASDPNTLARLRQQIADAIARRARDKPLAFILEDLQYAGDPGMDLVEFLAQHLHDVPVVFFVSLRTSGERPDVVPADVRTRLHLEGGRSRTIVVPTLDDAAARRLIEAGLHAQLPPATVAAIVDEAVAATGGVPRRIRRLTERLGTLAHVDVAGLRSTVREFAMNNLSLLSEKESEIIQLEAVLQMPLPDVAYPVVARSRYWDLSERDLRKYLPKLGNFLTPSTFEAVVAGLDPDLLASDHLNCAQALEAAYGDTMPLGILPLVGRHYEAAGQPERAGRYYLQAALAFNDQNMNEPAQQHLGLARAIYEHLGDYDTLAEIDYLLGWTRYKLGDCAPAKRDLDEALADYDKLAPGDDPALAARRQVRRDRAALLLGVITAVGEQHYDQAVPYLQSVVNSADDRVRALAQITLGYCLYRKDPVEAERLARAGLAEARRHNNPFTIAQALQYLAIILMNRREPAALEEALVALNEAAQVGEADKYLLAQIYNTMGDAYAQRGDDATAIEYLQQSLALKQETGDVAGQAFSYGALGRAYRRIGRHAAALDSFARDLAIVEKQEDQEAPRIQMHCELADVLRLRGDLPAALTEIGRASAIIATLPAGNLRQRQEAFRDLAAAQVVRAQGRPAQALVGVRRARAAFAAIGFRFMLPQCDLVEGGILRDLRDLPAAATRLDAAAATRLDPYDAAWLAHEQAALARAQGDLPAAAAYQARALDLARQLHNPWLEARFTRVEGINEV